MAVTIQNSASARPRPRIPAQSIDPDANAKIDCSNQVGEPEQAQQIRSGEFNQYDAREQLLCTVRHAREDSHASPIAWDARMALYSPASTTAWPASPRDLVREGNLGCSPRPSLVPDPIHDQRLLDQETEIWLVAPGNRQEGRGQQRKKGNQKCRQDDRRGLPGASVPAIDGVALS